MTVEQYDPKQADNWVVLTEEAKQHFIQQLAKKQNHTGVRLSVKASGCSGYQYVLDWVEAALDSDLQMPLSDDKHLIIDSQALNLIRGTEILLKKEGLNETIEFKNPNVIGTCGCGESFTV